MLKLIHYILALWIFAQIYLFFELHGAGADLAVMECVFVCLTLISWTRTPSFTNSIDGLTLKDVPLMAYVEILAINFTLAWTSLEIVTNRTRSLSTPAGIECFDQALSILIYVLSRLLLWHWFWIFAAYINLSLRLILEVIEHEDYESGENKIKGKLLPLCFATMVCMAYISQPCESSRQRSYCGMATLTHSIVYGDRNMTYSTISTWKNGPEPFALHADNVGSQASTKITVSLPAQCTVVEQGSPVLAQCKYEDGPISSQHASSVAGDHTLEWENGPNSSTLPPLPKQTSLLTKIERFEATAITHTTGL